MQEVCKSTYFSFYINFDNLGNVKKRAFKKNVRKLSHKLKIGRLINGVKYPFPPIDNEFQCVKVN
jgi:hypothetical protein